MVCGVWAQSHQQSILTKGRAKTVLPSGSVYIGSVRVMQDLSFLQEVPPMADYAGQQAGCRLSEYPWKTADKTPPHKVRIPRQIVHYEDDDAGGGFAVTFRQSGPAAGG